MNKTKNTKNRAILFTFIVILTTIFLIVLFTPSVYGVSIDKNNESSTSIIINENLYGVNKTKISKNLKVPYKKTYKISPKSKPIDKKLFNSILKDKSYNKNTKHYYTIISYMKLFEKSGGGTIILTKGNYLITESIAVPSNVNIILENGAILKKWMKTGTNKFGSSTAVFQLIGPSKVKKSNVYKKYKGAYNINIIGKGTAIVDLRYKKGALAIVCGHNKNINIQGITFKNLNNGHFIELDATENMKISKCKFIGSKPSDNLVKEAINLDTPDKATEGFHNPWSSYDKTPNKNILIENNLFKGLDRAIGTHKYSQKKYNGKYTVNKYQQYHTNIVVRNNIINNTRSEGIRVLNWKNSKITNNYIANIPKKKNYRGMLVTGVNITIRYNYFVNMLRPIQFRPSKNTGPGSEYSITYTYLNGKNRASIKYNLCRNVNENFASITNLHNNFLNSEKIPMLKIS